MDKRLLKQRFRQWRWPALVMLGLLPPVLALQAFLTTASFGWAWLFAALAFLAAGGCMLLPGKRRLPAGLLAAALIGFLGWRFLPWQGSVPLLAIPLVFIGALLACLPMGGWDPRREVSLTFCGTTLVLAAAAQIAGMAGGGKSPVKPALPGIQAAFAAFALLYLLSLNRETLSGNGEKKAAPLPVRRRNVLLTVAVGGTAGLIALLPQLTRWLQDLWGLIRSGIAAFLSWLASLLPPVENAAGPGAGAGFDGLGPETAEAVPPSLLMQILRTVLLWLAALAMLFLLLWMLRKLLRKLGLLKKLLSRFAQAASEDYEDIIEDTRLDGSHAETRRARRGLRRWREKGLAPRELVRLRYRRLSASHPEWAPGATAREQLPEAAAALYEKARYSDHPVDAAEAEGFLRRPHGHAGPPAKNNG